MQKIVAGIALGGMIAGALAVGITACATSSGQNVLETQPGQLFCAIETQGGGQIVAGIVQTAAAPAVGPAAPLVVLATNATDAFVRGACDQAAKNIGGKAGVPVSPPANPATVPPVAVNVAKVAG